MFSDFGGIEKKHLGMIIIKEIMNLHCGSSGSRSSNFVEVDRNKLNCTEELDRIKKIKKRTD